MKKGEKGTGSMITSVRRRGGCTLIPDGNFGPSFFDPLKLKKRGKEKEKKEMTFVRWPSGISERSCCLSSFQSRKGERKGEERVLMSGFGGECGKNRRLFSVREEGEGKRKNEPALESQTPLIVIVLLREKGGKRQPGGPGLDLGREGAAQAGNDLL